jgi:integrase
MRSRRTAKRAAATLDWYESILPRLLESCPDYPAIHDIEDWLATAPSAESARNWLHAARAMYNWASKRHGIPNPTHAIVPATPARKLPRVFTMDELRRILDAASDPRDLAAITVLIDTGVRIGELASIRTESIDAEGLLVTGKRGQRRVPLSPGARRALMRVAPASGPIFQVLPRRRPRVTPSGATIELPSRRRGGQPGNTNRRVHGAYSLLDPLPPSPARPMAQSTLELRIRSVVERAGITGDKLGPHTFRHTFATAYLRAGGDLYRLQRLMGHSSIKETQVYLSLSDPEAFAEHARLSPLVQLRGAV